MTNPSTIGKLRPTERRKPAGLLPSPMEPAQIDTYRNHAEAERPDGAQPSRTTESPHGLNCLVGDRSTLLSRSTARASRQTASSARTSGPLSSSATGPGGPVLRLTLSNSCPRTRELPHPRIASRCPLNTTQPQHGGPQDATGSRCTQHSDQKTSKLLVKSNFGVACQQIPTGPSYSSPHQHASCTPRRSSLAKEREAFARAVTNWAFPATYLRDYIPSPVSTGSPLHTCS